MTIRMLLFIFAFGVAVGPALAELRTVTLDVQSMNCAVCPITVKKALEQVSGVQEVSIDYAAKTATVRFDDTVTAAEQLTEATGAAGYPSSIKKEPK